MKNLHLLFIKTITVLSFIGIAFVLFACLTLLINLF
jgi:hypothetical protein